MRYCHTYIIILCINAVFFSLQGVFIDIHCSKYHTYRAFFPALFFFTTSFFPWAIVEQKLRIRERYESQTVLISGESGAGKILGSQRFSESWERFGLGRICCISFVRKNTKWLNFQKKQWEIGTKVLVCQLFGIFFVENYQGSMCRHIILVIRTNICGCIQNNSAITITSFYRIVVPCTDLYYVTQIQLYSVFWQPSKLQWCA